MVPIELVWFIVLLIFSLIGVVRGFLRELGVTMVMVIMLFAATFFEGKITQFLTKAAAQMAPDEVATLQAGFWVVVIVVVAFASYHGETLSFKGHAVGGVLGVAVNLITGLANGYLITGSIWYYLHRLGYPLLRISQDSLSPLAQSLVPLLPPKLLAPYLLYMALLLVFLRVIR